MVEVRWCKGCLFLEYFGLFDYPRQNKAQFKCRYYKRTLRPLKEQRGISKKIVNIYRLDKCNMKVINETASYRTD